MCHSDEKLGITKLFMKKHEPFVAMKAFLIGAFAIILGEWIDGPMSIIVSVTGVVIGFGVFLHGMIKE